MSSSKTTSALHMSRRLQRLGKSVTLVRPIKSIRDHEEKGILKTKNGESFPSTDLESSLDILSIPKSDVIWIDEPFLFPDEEKLFDVVQEIRKNTQILISSLGADVNLAPFKISVPKLLASSDEVLHFKNDCDVCLGSGIATRTLLVADLSLDNQVLVGSSNLFKSSCVNCWNEMMQISPKDRLSKIGSKC